jgi:hypothetical protein
MPNVQHETFRDAYVNAPSLVTLQFRDRKRNEERKYVKKKRAIKQRERKQ